MTSKEKVQELIEKYATEIFEQVRNGASISDVMQLLQDFENEYLVK